ncbi:MAG: cobalamin B12-binding domain-containing protein, partial [Anaerovoracaceae bacterium]
CRKEAMSRKKILAEAKDVIVRAEESRIEEVIEAAEREGIGPIELLQDGFTVGNLEVGDRFEHGLISLPELIFSTEVMRKAIDAVTATMKYDGKPKGKVLIATVAGDIHDIGKSIVASTMRGYGIEVIDIGREVSVEEIIRQAEKHKVDIIATSALLTSTLKEQRNLEQALEDAGLKVDYKTMVGGAPCTLRWAKRIGATAYSEDAIDACRKALSLLEKIRL